KVDPTGSSLQYSTFLGGAGDDWANGIATDPAGHAYITGFTGSLGYPTTAGVFQPQSTGTDLGGGVASNSDAFVTKLSTDGGSLVYSTFLGGSANENGSNAFHSKHGIAIDASGNAFVTGETYSHDFPTTPNAVQGQWGYGLPNQLAFVTKLNPTGTGLV